MSGVEQGEADVAPPQLTFVEQARLRALQVVQKGLQQAQKAQGNLYRDCTKKVSTEVPYYRLSEYFRCIQNHVGAERRVAEVAFKKLCAKGDANGLERKFTHLPKSQLESEQQLVLDTWLQEALERINNQIHAFRERPHPTTTGTANGIKDSTPEYLDAMASEPASLIEENPPSQVVSGQPVFAALGHSFQEWIQDAPVSANPSFFEQFLGEHENTVAPTNWEMISDPTSRSWTVPLLAATQKAFTEWRRQEGLLIMWTPPKNAMTTKPPIERKKAREALESARRNFKTFDNDLLAHVDRLVAAAAELGKGWHERPRGKLYLIELAQQECAKLLSKLRQCIERMSGLARLQANAAKRKTKGEVQHETFVPEVLLNHGTAEWSWHEARARVMESSGQLR